MSDKAQLSKNLASVRERVASACGAVNRDPSEVTILPVSKTFDVPAIQHAVELGLRRFGENRVQEIRDKATAFASGEIVWVVIGPLQTNKVKYVARLASEVQTLDRLDLAQALDRRLQKESRAIDVLVQVKTSPEDSKHGLAPTDLPELLAQLASFDTLHIRGLMTIATHTDDKDEVRRCFAQLRQLAGQHGLSRLSMGMSGDFALAIAEGATEVRIGSAIFGQRE